LSGNKWQLENLVSESKAETLHDIHFIKLKDAAAIFFTDRQWTQSAKMVQNKKKKVTLQKIRRP